MSEPCETSGRPLASTTEQQQQPKHTPSTSLVHAPKDKRRKRLSTSSNGTTADTKSVSSRRRSETTDESTIVPNTGSSHFAQRSTISPNSTSLMSTVNYTKTGRVSKAKKGLKVHDCECGRSYTRAEHLRRHRRNHGQEGALFCKYPDCGKTFYRTDLLQRHEERHNEAGNVSRQPSISSSDHSAHTSPMSMPAALPLGSTNTLPPSLIYTPPQVLSPHLEATAFSRYNPNLFRTPQLPRTSKIAPFNPSNHVFRSSPSFKSPPINLKRQGLAFPTRHSISGPILVDGGMASGGHWHESFAQSPYSCSSGHASPMPGPEYSHTYATPPYGSNMIRTRASSNASFVGPWGQGSQSPTSSVSTSFQYSWPPEEKNMMASSFPYIPASYSTVDMPLNASVDPLGHYGHFCASNVAQVDHEKGLELFPEEQYGMSQIVHTYQFEQYLNNYWRLFDPTFPIIHRPTFASLEAPPMLYAAMIAIGAQHSNDIYGRQIAIKLHKTCVKLLDERDRSNLTRCERLCDHQAIFLVEVFAQYSAQRCAKTLSTRFMAMYRKLVGMRGLIPSAILKPTSLVPTSEDKSQDLWIQWVELSARQHLLLSCYILESQQSTLLARDSDLFLQFSSHDLPFPVHRSLWDTTSSRKWVVSQHHLESPITVFEASNSPVVGRYDPFQSAVLIAAHYTHSIGPSSGTNSGIEKFLDDSLPTLLHLRTAKLTQLVPMRALLAVSGETWILGTKVTSESEFSALRITLQTWIGQLWSSTVDEYLQPTLEALHLSIDILKQSFESSEPPTWGMGSEMSLFLAAMVIWAATVAANSRLASSFSFQQSQSSLASHSSMLAMVQPTVVPHVTNHLTYSKPAHHLSELDQDIQTSTVPAFPDGRTSIPHSEILLNTSRFLASAFEDITSFNIASCQHGCTSLLLWVKMVVRGASLSNQESAATDAGSSGELHGELSYITLGQIERMLGHGWEGWGI